MALRVLLADESSTIKRVMQLALQDFAVEVKAVHAGVDVLEVARTFRPDIVFADVLLQKRNGYEVSRELKDDGEMKSVPVILMWSSFMELDQAAYAKSKANGKLEKPFDVEQIRKLVKDNVAKLRGDTLSEYLQFPSSISAPLKTEETQKKSAAAARPATPPAAPRVPDAPPPMPTLSDDDGDSPFRASDLTATKTRDLPPPPPVENESEDWVKQDISSFTLDLPPIKLGGDDASISFDVHHGSIDGEKQYGTSTSTSLSNEPTTTAYNLRSPPFERTKAEEIPFPDFDQLQSTDAHLPHVPEVDFEPNEIDLTTEPVQLDKQLTSDQLEKIIRAQSKEVIEEVVRKVVPELATQIIREELNRLLAENGQ